MSRKPTEVVPLGDLLTALNVAGVDTKGNLPISLATGLHVRTVIRARRTGYITRAAADRACTRALGTHPCTVWHNWFEESE